MTITAFGTKVSVTKIQSARTTFHLSQVKTKILTIYLFRWIQLIQESIGLSTTLITFLDIGKLKQPKKLWTLEMSFLLVIGHSLCQEVLLPHQVDMLSTGREIITGIGKIWLTLSQVSWIQICLVCLFLAQILVALLEKPTMKLESFVRDGFNLLLSIHLQDKTKMM